MPSSSLKRVNGDLTIQTTDPESVITLVTSNVVLTSPLKLAVYANVTARNTAIPSPTRGEIVFLIDDGSSGGSPQVPRFQGYTGAGWVNLN